MERLIPLSEILSADDQRPDEDYIAERRRIEEAHGNDDRTEMHFRRDMGSREMYVETDEPITDSSPLAAMGKLGMTDQLLGILDAAGFSTVGDLRREWGAGRLIDVMHVGERSVRKVRLFFRRLDRR